MTIEYLLVAFPEEEQQRAVLADGDPVGFTNHTLMLPSDEYKIALEGGCLPASKDVVLTGTSIMKPKVISFDPPAAPSTASNAKTSRKG